MRKQYHLRPVEHGFDAWDIDRLIELSRGLPVERIGLDSIADIDSNWWFQEESQPPTVRRIVEHARLINEVETGHPIILDHDGRVMDGMHRIARAMLEGRAEIDAVRLTAPTDPDYRNCNPDELPYERS